MSNAFCDNYSDKFHYHFFHKEIMITEISKEKDY